MKVCSKCGITKSDEDFSWKLMGKRRCARCKLCHNIYRKHHYEINKKYYLNRNKIRRKNIRQFILGLKLKCVTCLETHPACLSFHHKNPKNKYINLAHATTRGWSKKRIIGEAKKCVILCCNCHMKLHWKKRNVLS